MWTIHRTKRLSDNNYVLDVDGREAYIHMNSLRLYHEKDDGENHDVVEKGTDETPAVTVLVIINCDGDACVEALGEAENTTVTEGDAESIKLGKQLTPDQQEAIKALIANYPDIFSGGLSGGHLTELSTYQQRDEIKRSIYRQRDGTKPPSADNANFTTELDRKLPTGRRATVTGAKFKKQKRSKDYHVLR